MAGGGSVPWLPGCCRRRLQHDVPLSSDVDLKPVFSRLPPAGGGVRPGIPPLKRTTTADIRSPTVRLQTTDRCSGSEGDLVQRGDAHGMDPDRRRRPVAPPPSVRGGGKRRCQRPLAICQARRTTCSASTGPTRKRVCPCSSVFQIRTAGGRWNTYSPGRAPVGPRRTYSSAACSSTAPSLGSPHRSYRSRGAARSAHAAVFHDERSTCGYQQGC